ncbi:MAG: hypothetical protein KBC73_20360 [Burkholderiaceae bacterium]|nr:hypothetical protein [Burkholderiaceae bacterium]
MLVTVLPAAALRRPPPAAWRSSEPSLRDWLAPYRPRLLRWALGRGDDGTLAGPQHGLEQARRRAVQQATQALHRLRGAVASADWLFAAAVMAARERGRLQESSLVGLPPELRSTLRLVAGGHLRAEDALALLPQPMDRVREHLLGARLGCSPVNYQSA